MKVVFTKQQKRVVEHLLFIIAVLVAMHYIRIGAESDRDLRRHMYADFDHFGKALIEMNTSISKVLIMSDAVDQEKSFISRTEILDFRASKLDAADWRNIRDTEDMVYFYLDFDYVMSNILSDHKINDNESAYLNKVYDYNFALIQDYEKIIEGADLNFDKKDAIEKEIMDIYNQFSEKAVYLLNSDTYSEIKTYHGELIEENRAEIEAFCQKVFKVLMPNRTLKAAEWDEMQCVFKTDDEINSTMDTIEYTVDYNQGTNWVTVDASSYVVPEKQLSEQELDEIAMQTSMLFDNELVLTSKTYRYNSNNEISDNVYVFSKWEDGSYVDMSNDIEINVEVHGILGRVRMIYPKARSEVSQNQPILSKEAVAGLFDSKLGELKSCILKREISGRYIYEVEYEFKEQMYKAILDAENSEVIAFTIKE